MSNGQTVNGKTSSSCLPLVHADLREKEYVRIRSCNSDLIVNWLLLFAGNLCGLKVMFFALLANKKNA